MHLLKKSLTNLCYIYILENILICCIELLMLKILNINSLLNILVNYIYGFSNSSKNLIICHFFHDLPYEYLVF
jgi:hypothetical protein